MSYADARSTKLLATSCLVCGLPLRDPHSLETGIGPICREKHGYETQGNPETRAQVSKLIHSAAEPGTTAVDIYAIADKIEALGFPDVANKVRTRFAKAYKWETGKSKALPVIIKEEMFSFRGKKEMCILLHTPYERASTGIFNNEMKNMISGDDRTGVKIGDTFYWVVKSHRRPDVMGLLLAHFEGRMCHGPKGSFIIGEKPAEAEVVAVVVEAPAQVAVAPTPAVPPTQPVPAVRTPSDAQVELATVMNSLNLKVDVVALLDAPDDKCRATIEVLRNVFAAPTPIITPVPAVTATVTEEDWGNLD